MYSRKIKISLVKLLFFLYSSIIISSPGQNTQLRFDKYDANNGLSQQMINDIVQDSIGFMWFATRDGLNRFDGNTFKVYRSYFNDSNTLSDNHIISLLVDSKNKLWVATKNGINFFIPEKDRFIRVLKNEGEASSQNYFFIKRIVEDLSGGIWAGARNGTLYQIEQTEEQNGDFKLKAIDIHPENNSSYDLTDLYDFLFISQKEMLAAFSSGVYRIEIREGYHQYKIEKLISGVFAKLYYDGDYYWAGSYGKLTKIEFKDEELSSINFNIYGKDEKFFTWEYSVKGIIELDKKDLLITTDNGLVRFDRINNKFSFYRFAFEETVDHSDHLTTLYEDRSKNIWIGTAGLGIKKINFSKNFFRYITCGTEKNKTQSIKIISEDEKGRLWFQSMDDNVYYIDNKTGLAKRIVYNGYSLRSYVDFETIGGDQVLLLCTDALINFNTATNEGEIFEYSSAEDYYDQYERILLVKKSEVWIASTTAVLRFDRITGELSKYNYPAKDFDRVLGILTVDNGFWISRENFLLFFDISDKNFTSYSLYDLGTSSSRIRAIAVDPLNINKILWLGTDGGGLNRIDLNTKEVKIFTTKNGLPNDVVYGIVFDERSIWLSTNMGISRFNLTDKTFRNYNFYDGLQGNEFNTNSFYRSKSGIIYFGGLNGITYFNPRTDRPKSFTPNIVITEFKIFNDVISPDKYNSLLKNIVTFTNEISLPYDQNSFGFEFAALDFTAPRNNRYKYKLENFDRDWIDNGTSREATYTNIPPGEYKFRVIGSNNFDTWSEKGAAILISISPPFWQTWWAYIIYAGAVFTIIYFFINYERKKNQLKLEVISSNLEKRKLEELNNLKSRFLANISHEFRTPLALILGPAIELKDELKDRYQSRLIDIINKNGKQLLKLVNQLLDLSRLESNKFPVKNERINLITFVKGYLQSLSHLAEENRVSLIFQSDFTELEIMFDPDMLEKIVNNLVSNSLKFTKEGDTVEVDIKVSNDQKSFLIIVKDNGAGIEKKNLDQVFNAFYQSADISTIKHGFGIGLALVKELVELLKGNIDLKSRIGEGTCFTLTFPLIKADSIQEEDDNGVPLLEEDYTTEHLVEDKKIILVIEDNEDVQNYIKEKLKSEFIVIGAIDGNDGIEKTKKILPDLVVSDIMMPKMSGIDFCNTIKSDLLTSHIPIILLSARADDESKLEGLECGADDYITKPFNPKELTGRINSILRNREILKEKFKADFYINSTYTAPKTRDEEFLDKIYSILDRNLGKIDFSVNDLASELFLSTSQLYRKIKGLTNLSTVKLIQNYRLKKAADMINQKRHNISEICYLVGFSDPSYFSKCFKSEFGCTPQDYPNLS